MSFGNISKHEKLKQIKLKVTFEHLKSSYILQILFNFMQKDKALEIIRYNKRLQKRLNIGIDDYKELCQLIEIELKIADNKYGKFINISDKKKKYYHIYFDNSNNEIERNYLKEYEKVKMIKIIIDYQITSFNTLFQNCGCISSIYFKRFYRNNITEMAGMFSYCSSLQEINLSKFNTDNVTNMRYMFSGCSSLKKLDLYRTTPKYFENCHKKIGENNPDPFFICFLITHHYKKKSF